MTTQAQKPKRGATRTSARGYIEVYDGQRWRATRTLASAFLEHEELIARQETEWRQAHQSEASQPGSAW